VDGVSFSSASGYPTWSNGYVLEQIDTATVIDGKRHPDDHTVI
jgi:hypothetical protein